MVLYSAVSSPLYRSKRFTLSSPGRPVHSDTVLGFSWKHSSHAAIAQRLFTHISTTVYSQVLIYTAESILFIVFIIIEHKFKEALSLVRPLQQPPWPAGLTPSTCPRRGQGWRWDTALRVQLPWDREPVQPCGRLTTRRTSPTRE